MCTLYLQCCWWFISKVKQTPLSVQHTVGSWPRHLSMLKFWFCLLTLIKLLFINTCHSYDFHLWLFEYAWSMRSGTIRRCGLVEGNVSPCRWLLGLPVQKKHFLLAAFPPRWRVKFWLLQYPVCLHAAMLPVTLNLWNCKPAPIRHCLL